MYSMNPGTSEAFWHRGKQSISQVIDAGVVFLGQRAALQAIQQQLQPDELLLAYLDDIYAVVPPTRVRAVYDLMAHARSRREVLLEQCDSWLRDPCAHDVVRFG